jgi:hypothetical protein
MESRGPIWVGCTADETKKDVKAGLPHNEKELAVICPTVAREKESFIKRTTRDNQRQA